MARKRIPIQAFAIVTGRGRGLLTRDERMPIYWYRNIAERLIEELKLSGYSGLHVEPVTVTFVNAASEDARPA